MSFFEPIAIIGQGCVLPGCNSPNELFDMIIDGKVNISSAPLNNWRISLDEIISDVKIQNKTYHDKGGYVSGFENIFDSSNYNLDSKLIEELDSVFKWSLYAANQALKDANVESPDIKKKTGVILGNLSYPSRLFSKLFEQIYLEENFSDLNSKEIKVNPINRFMSGLPSIYVKKALGLGGDAFSLDAACASGLYAIKLACDKLRDGSSDLMLAGAVNAADQFFLHVGFTTLTALSPTGQSRPFNKDADGLIPAEGSAFVVLKRLSEAKKDNNNILGVIRGIGLSNDGCSGGFLSPSVKGQIRCMDQAFKCSGLNPSDVSFIECHATGTKTGDSIEIESMSEVFEGCKNIPIGSLKANLGHLITASGVAGLIKVLECMKHGRVAQTPNAFPLLNAILNSPFNILENSKAWDVEKNKVACISSFGFGGNNAHLIVEEFNNNIFVPVSAKNKKIEKVAVVGLGICTDKIENISELSEVLLSGKNNLDKNIEEVTFKPKDLNFPPKDLKQTLGQQLILLKVAREALNYNANISHEDTGVFIGMGADSETNRYCFRERLKDLLKERNIHVTNEWLEEAKRKIAPVLESSGVVGTMPNIPANRINNQYDFCGMGFTVSCEELSGDKALDLAVDAIVNNEIETAIVGAVDLSNEKTHKEVLKKELKIDKTCDAAVVLILKKYSKAVRDNDIILSTIGDSEIKNDRSSNVDISSIIGHAHACKGLLNITAGIVLAMHKADFKPSENKASPFLRDKNIQFKINNNSFTGESSILKIESYTNNKDVSFSPNNNLKIYTYSASSKESLIESVKNNIQSDKNNNKYKLAFVAKKSESNKLLDQALNLLINDTIREGWNNDRIVFRKTAIDGELAFAYTGAASAYHGMGKELLFYYPQLVNSLKDRLKNPVRISGWIYDDKDNVSKLPFYQLSGSSFMCQIHSEFTLKVLGLQPKAVLGMSSGETNSMFAFGVWDDIDGLFENIYKSGMYTSALGERFEAVKEFWKENKNFVVKWDNWRILASVEKIKELIKQEDRVYLTIINTDNDCIIGGDRESCKRVIDKIGTSNVMPIHHDIAIHCPVVKPFEKTWRKLHTKKTKEIKGVRFYSNYLDGVYKITTENVADALTGQALKTIDFPKIVKKAYNDGVRIFLEHGPRNFLSLAIDEILRNKPHLAVSLDVAGESSILQVMKASAQLWCAGVKMDLKKSKLCSNNKKMSIDKKLTLNFPLHMPVIKFPSLDNKVLEDDRRATVLMKPAPKLMLTSNNQLNITREDLSPRNKNLSIGNNLSERDLINDEVSFIKIYYKNFVDRHKEYIITQKEVFDKYISCISNNIQMINPGIEKLKRNKFVNNKENNHVKYQDHCFDRRELEILASGKISSVLGPLFEKQDNYDVQVRLPEPPLLLCDRVTGIKGEPGSLGLGTIWTETDVREDSWYLHTGRMPAGIFIEAGQADLLLISWLGIDFHNKGERAYRLLGCELVFHRHLPKPGDTLKYDIHVDGYAEQGDVRLFFFHYDCHINGNLSISVRNGQAGFFSTKELEESGGVIWNPETANYKENVVIELPNVHTKKSSFNKDEVLAYTEGNICKCFGEEFYYTETHTRTPRSQSGLQNFIEEVKEFNLHGGPKKRGYLKSESIIKGDEWYFKGHFKNDPCMPGTLMAEACLQMMTFYMVGSGLTVKKDGWRFEPVSEEKYKFICRGQVIPTSKNIIYEVFVDELIENPYPTLYAHVLVTVDGKKAFLCERLGLKLVPDWPLTSMQSLLEYDETNHSIAEYNGFKFDYKSLINCALGKPSLAYGDIFEPYDNGLKKSSRLPSPPYHFMSRVINLNAKFGDTKNNPSIEIEYDIPEDAWYFRENTSKIMPYCVLMEIALQPCGWLASFTLDQSVFGEELLFRNLDGLAIQYKEIKPKSDSVITTKSILTSVSKTGQLIILKFDVKCLIDGEIIYKMQTAFGFFPPKAMLEQKGLKISDAEVDNFKKESNFSRNLKIYPKKYFKESSAKLVQGKLLMLDRITGYWKNGGRQGLGYIRAEKDVVAWDWFFKAHFFQDPVQPGSLGIEAIIQLVQFYMLNKDLHKDMNNPRFEPIIIQGETEWHYRGQVTPDNKLITVDMDVLEEGRDDKGKYVVVDARLWVDGLKIYQAPKIGVRLIEGVIEEKKDLSSKIIKEWKIDINDSKWIEDHKPTYTVPTLPFTFMMDMMAQEACKIFPNKKLIKIDKVISKKWISFEKDIVYGRSIVRVIDNKCVEVNLEKQQENINNYKTCISGLFYFSDNRLSPTEEIIDTLKETVPINTPYKDGLLFHGYSLQLMNSWILGRNGASCKVDNKNNNCPKGVLNPALLDASLHCIPLDNFNYWANSIPKDIITYPVRIDEFYMYKEIPIKGAIKVEVRFKHLEFDKLPVIKVFLKDNSEELVATFFLMGITLSKGVFGKMLPGDRKKFIIHKEYIKDISISKIIKNKRIIYFEDVKKVNWLKGTLNRIYGLSDNISINNLAKQIALKEHIAHQVFVHPSKIIIDSKTNQCKNFNSFKLEVEEKDQCIVVYSSKKDMVQNYYIEKYPLTKQQEALWFLYKFNPLATNYNLYHCDKITGNLDVNLLFKSVHAMFNYWDTCKTKFVEEDGEVYQEIYHKTEQKVEYIDLTRQSLNLVKNERRAFEIMNSAKNKPFDLLSEYPSRIILIKCSESVYYFSSIMHHIIMDGFSSQMIITSSILYYYKGLEGVKKLFAQKSNVGDYLKYIQNNRTPEKYQEILQYWQKKLEDRDFQFNFRQQTIKNIESKTVKEISFNIEEDIKKQIMEVCIKNNSSLFIFLAAVLNTLLYRYWQEEDIVIGYIVNVRKKGLLNLMGHYVDQFPLRTYIRGDNSFIHILKNIIDQRKEDIKFQDISLVEIVRALRKQNLENDYNDFSISLGQTMFSVNLSDGKKEDLDVVPISVFTGEITKDLTILYDPQGKDLQLKINYNANKFGSNFVQRFSKHFQNIIKSIVRDLNKKVSDIELLAKEEKDTLLIDWNNTRADYPKDKAIYELFEKQVKETPDNVAIIYSKNELTYKELNKRINQLARKLRQKGVKRESIVGIMLKRSIEMIVGIYAILKAGGTYLPIDPEYPDDRVNYIVQDSNTQLILTQAEYKEKLSKNFNGEVIDLKEKEIYEGDDSDLDNINTSKDLAYIIYTSGSTGKPKGVMIEHRSLVNRLNWMQKMYPIGKDDTILQKTVFTFDVSVWELFWWSIVGAKLCLLCPGGEKDPELIVNTIDENSITVMHFVPSMLNVFLEHIKDYANIKILASLKQVFSSGEALSLTQVKSFNEILHKQNGTKLANLYGPTEATIDVSFFNCFKGEDLEVIPIGKPIDNIKFFIVDKFKQIQPIGTPGELCIAGDGLARGYLNNPELTKQKFVKNPYILGGNMYLTGDLVRMLPDGNIEFLNRIDNQVKIRGFRIELGEIESYLLSHKSIRGTVVIDFKDKNDNKFLCAYFVSNKKIILSELKEYLAKKLPEYMVPAFFMQIESMPLTPNGKLNRKALPKPETDNIIREIEFVAPKSELEKKLVDIWREVLQVEQIGVHDDFFALGGDSILAVKLGFKLNKVLTDRISIKFIFLNPTIYKMAKYIEQGEVKDEIIDLNEEAVLDTDICVKDKKLIAVDNPENILLTGSTGFVGKFLLKELLDNTKTTIYCLGRSENSGLLFKKIKNLFISSDLWKNEYLTRIIPVVGDISKPRLGVNEIKFKELSKKIDVIYHNATFMDHLAGYERLKPTNVGGTKEILRLACMTKLKPVHYSSTVSVFNGNNKSINELTSIEEEKHFNSSGYATSKWVAEKIIMIAQKRGIPCNIYRFGLITGDSKKGRYDDQQWLYQLMESSVLLGYSFNKFPQLRFQITPVDYVVKSLVYLSKQKDLRNRIFHLTNPKIMPIEELFSLYNQISLNPLKQVSIYEWLEYVKKYVDKGNSLPIYPLIEEYTGLEEDMFKERIKEVEDILVKLDCKMTMSELEKAQIICPKIDKKLVEIYFNFFSNSKSFINNK